MLLIRQWIAMNQNHFGGMHTAFFVFTVGNIGGALLLVGPPLFLGYLKGVPFLWALQRCWLPWSVTLAAVLIIFCVLDSLHFRRDTPHTSAQTSPRPAKAGIAMARSIFIFMLVILAALIAAAAGWREIIMVSIAVAAYLFTPRHQFSSWSPSCFFGNEPRRLRFEVVLVNCSAERRAGRKLCLLV
jgi:Na+/H+ antiporter NhaD/arsenite permease-like protein